MPPILTTTQQILEALQQGGYIATTDADAALAALKAHDRGALAANIHSSNVGVFDPGDVTAFLNWVFGSGPTAAELARSPAVVLALDAEVAALGDRDWRDAFVEALLRLQAEFAALPTVAGWGPPRQHVHKSFAVRHPDAVFGVTYEEVDASFLEGAYLRVALTFEQTLGAPLGLKQLDQSILAVLRTGEGLKYLLESGVDEVNVVLPHSPLASVLGPDKYTFAVSNEAHLVNRTTERRLWGHDLPLVETRSRSGRNGLVEVILAFAEARHLTATADTFKTGIGEFGKKHNVVFVEGGGEEPMAQLTFHQTADGNLVLFFDQATRFGQELMQPNMYNFFTSLFNVIPRGTLARGSYRFESGDSNFGVWHLPEGAEFPQQYFPTGGYYLHPERGSIGGGEGFAGTNRSFLGVADLAGSGQAASSLTPSPLPSPSPTTLGTGTGGEGSKVGGGGAGDAEASVRLTVVRRQPTGGAEQRVHPVMLRGGEIVAGGAPFDGNTALEFDTSIIAEPEVVLDPQPRLRLVESEQPTDDSAIKQLLSNNTSPAANTDVEVTGDNFPPAGNTFHAMGPSHIGVHRSAVVKLMAIH